jgi:hypothetical protein
MRPALFVPLSLGLLAACGPDTELQPATVQWLEWPAEVLVATPFEARLFLLPPVCFPHSFRPGVTHDESAITIAPFYLVERVEPICPPLVQSTSPSTLPSTSPVPSPVRETMVTLPGLAATSAHVLEMRASANSDEPQPLESTVLPVRTFGDVTVRLSDPDSSRRNAGGRVVLFIDNQGCARIEPGGLFSAGVRYVLEDQADTVGLFLAFVRGYLHDVTTPVCGETRVFHLSTRG